MTTDRSTRTLHPSTKANAVKQLCQARWHGSLKDQALMGISEGRIVSMQTWREYIEDHTEERVGERWVFDPSVWIVQCLELTHRGAKTFVRDAGLPQCVHVRFVTEVGEHLRTFGTPDYFVDTSRMAITGKYDPVTGRENVSDRYIRFDRVPPLTGESIYSTRSWKPLAKVMRTIDASTNSRGAWQVRTVRSDGTSSRSQMWAQRRVAPVIAVHAAQHTDDPEAYDLNITVPTLLVEPFDA